MLVLVLDTATAAVTAGVVDVTSERIDVRGERVVVNARGHGELLAPNIAAALHDAGATPRDLGAIVAGLGPGPYTGLRVGLVTAAVMGDALDVPTYGVCSLDAVALANPGDGELVVATDARRREVYWARYDAARHATHRTRRSGARRRAARRRDRGRRCGRPALRRRVRAAAAPTQDYPTVAALAAAAADRVRAGAPANGSNRSTCAGPTPSPPPSASR